MDSAAWVVESGEDATTAHDASSHSWSWASGKPKGPGGFLARSTAATRAQSSTPSGRPGDASSQNPVSTVRPDSASSIAANAQDDR